MVARAVGSEHGDAMQSTGVPGLEGREGGEEKGAEDYALFLYIILMYLHNFC